MDKEPLFKRQWDLTAKKLVGFLVLKTERFYTDKESCAQV